MASTSPAEACTPESDAGTTSTSDSAAPAPQVRDDRATAALLDPSADLPAERRCFVCLVDEPESALPADWCTPCHCSLEGHHDCLMEWVNNLVSMDKAVVCPLCKRPIGVVERPSHAIQLSNKLNKLFTDWSPTVALGFLASSCLLSSSWYGLQAIAWFAGPEATFNFLLKPDNRVSSFWLRRRTSPLEQAVNPVHFGILPLVAPLLVVNRLSVGEAYTIPVSFVYAMLFSHPSDILTWPPPPQRVMALYPAVKTAYFHLHRVARARVENMQTAPPAEIQPGGDEVQAAAPPPPPTPVDVAAEQDSPSFLKLVTGALLFPAVCYGMGEVLRRTLPSRFVTKPASAPSTGLLQERWGRSLIGGCLFVVMKDAFFLYVKYRKVMNRSHRRIRNVDRRNRGN
ncbi:hypothetical protein GGR56DRAFT_47349 [Xylariaceae sp. FL0804]|nr:hypothetical protein GGR56DRAFT_47349 [Xylariaceae sp. FL0804]